jgi:hypothetical protein
VRSPSSADVIRATPLWRVRLGFPYRTQAGSGIVASM